MKLSPPFKGLRISLKLFYWKKIFRSHFVQGHWRPNKKPRTNNLRHPSKEPRSWAKTAPSSFGLFFAKNQRLKTKREGKMINMRRWIALGWDEKKKPLKSKSFSHLMVNWAEIVTTWRRKRLSLAISLDHSDQAYCLGLRRLLKAIISSTTYSYVYTMQRDRLSISIISSSPWVSFRAEGKVNLVNILKIDQQE